MKLNFPLTIISILITLTLSFYFYSESNDIILTIGFIISSFIVCGPSLIFIYANNKTLVNNRVIAFLFFIVIILLSFLKMNNTIGDNIYVLISGISISIYLLLTYSINKSNI